MQHEFKIGDKVLVYSKLGWYHAIDLHTIATVVGIGLRPNEISVIGKYGSNQQCKQLVHINDLRPITESGKAIASIVESLKQNKLNESDWEEKPDWGEGW